MAENKYLRIAERAIDKYNIKVKELIYFTEETNIFYKVIDDCGTVYGLKILQDESSKIEDNLAEVFLLDTVRKKSDIVIPEVIYSVDGDSIVQIDEGNVNQSKRILVYKWIDGESIDEIKNKNYFYNLGVLTAKMHDSTMNVMIPQGINPKKWNKVFYYRDERAVYKEEKYKKFVTSEYVEIMDFIIPYLDEKLPVYYQDDIIQLIHADINPYNVLYHKDGLRIIDFEDVMLGKPVHDFAIIFFYYKNHNKLSYMQVKKDFFRGYALVRKIPDFTDFDLELLMTARRVNFLNYTLFIYDDPKKDYIDSELPRVKEFINTYIKI